MPLVKSGFGLAAIGMIMAMAGPTVAQAPKYPSWLFPRYHLQAVNCGYTQGVAIEALLRYGTAPGSDIKCYYKNAFVASPDILFELKIPASGASLEVAVSVTSVAAANNPANVRRHPAFQTLSCADAPILARYLLERHVYDGDKYLPMPKVTGCKVEQVTFPGKPPYLAPFGHGFSASINAKMIERRSIIYAVSLADLTRGLPPHLKRKK